MLKTTVFIIFVTLLAKVHSSKSCNVVISISFSDVDMICTWKHLHMSRKIPDSNRYCTFKDQLVYPLFFFSHDLNTVKDGQKV